MKRFSNLRQKRNFSLGDKQHHKMLFKYPNLINKYDESKNKINIREDIHNYGISSNDEKDNVIEINEYLNKKIDTKKAKA